MNKIPKILAEKMSLKRTVQAWNLNKVSNFIFGSQSAAKTSQQKYFHKRPEETPQETSVPILLPFSGETSNEVQAGLEEAFKVGNDGDPKIFGNLHQAFKNTIPGHNFRGYGILNYADEQPTIKVEKVREDFGLTRPLWFIFSGLGGQWNEMGKDLMKIDAFGESIQKSNRTLKNIGMNLHNLLKPGNEDLLYNIRDASIAITAIQIALYDTLVAVGLNPDGFIGYSAGEILCAYADGCLTAEETLLVSNARARALYDTRYTPGAMADVGLAWEDLNSNSKSKIKLPSGIYQACHNGPNNTSIVGPKQEMQTFLSKLKSKGIYTQEINSCGFAPHSKYIENAKYLMFNYLHETYKGDRSRTKKWLSTSIPEASWSSPIAQTANPSYFVNNALNPVLFHEILQKIPRNSVVIEIGPQETFQNLVNNILEKESTYVAPMDSKAEDKLSTFVTSLGQLYNAGLEIDFSNLYDSIKIPASASAAGTCKDGLVSDSDMKERVQQ